MCVCAGAGAARAEPPPELCLSPSQRAIEQLSRLGITGRWDLASAPPQLQAPQQSPQHELHEAHLTHHEAQQALPRVLENLTSVGSGTSQQYSGPSGRMYTYEVRTYFYPL